MWPFIIAALAFFTMLSFVSCGKDDPEYTLSVSRSTLAFSPEAGDVQHFDVICNTSWQITGQPDWIDIHPSAGSGTSSIEVKTLSGNSNSSEDRIATLTISAGDKQESVVLMQSSGLAQNCTVLPNEITTLCNGIAFDCTYGKNVVRFFAGYLNASEVGLMSDAEIINVLESNFERKSAEDGQVVVFSGLEAGKEYVVYTLGYDANGIRGDLKSVRVSTNAQLSNEPLAIISKPYVDGGRWNWSTTKNATCSYYYMMATQNSDLGFASDVFQAYLIDKGIREKEFESANINDGRWYMSKIDSYVFVWTRGFNSNNTASGEIGWNYAAESASSNSKVRAKEKAEVPKASYYKLPNPGTYKVYRLEQ